MAQKDNLTEALALFRQLQEEKQLTCLAHLRSLSAGPVPETVAQA